MVNIVAVDGPAGSGKSTVAKLVAKKLGYKYVDTGAMYRALTLKAINNRINLEDERALVELAKTSRIDLLYDKDDKPRVLLDDVDVTVPIRDPEVTNNVFYLAKVQDVRNEMVALQRKIGQHSSCVLEGRDITTVVFPKACYKFYMDADVKERAKRRYEELKKAGKDVKYEEVEHDLVERDYRDKTRKCGPLKKSEDAILIDTTNMDIDEVVEKICAYIKK